MQSMIQSLFWMLRFKHSNCFQHATVKLLQKLLYFFHRYVVSRVDPIDFVDLRERIRNPEKRRLVECQIVMAQVQGRCSLRLALRSRTFGRLRDFWIKNVLFRLVVTNDSLNVIWVFYKVVNQRWVLRIAERFLRCSLFVEASLFLSV